MTLLKIEVKTVTGKYHPEDMVKIWAPALRASGDAVVSTAPEIVKLVQGKAQVELLPGPARIQIMCGGTLDNAVRKVTIPDAANATLRAVLEDGFDWEPQIVTEVMRYRNGAVAASRSAAEDAADAANSATDAATSAGEAGSSATNAATSAQSAAASKTAAATSATNAATSATNAATSADEAATSEDTSLDAAAAAIAAAVSVAQFQGHGFPEGQVAAPVGSIYTDLDATAGAIRWIKTSGTGNTGWQVEYGDTGWRDVSADCDPAIVGNAKLYLRRCNERVYITFKGGSAVTGKLYLVPADFQPDLQPWNRPVTHVYRHGGATSSTMGLGGSLAWSDSIHLQGGSPFDSASSAHLSFPVSRAWPTTLPGTPV